MKAFALVSVVMSENKGYILPFLFGLALAALPMIFLEAGGPFFFVGILLAYHIVFSNIEIILGGMKKYSFHDQFEKFSFGGIVFLFPYFVWKYFQLF